MERSDQGSECQRNQEGGTETKASAVKDCSDEDVSEKNGDSTARKVDGNEEKKSNGDCVVDIKDGSTRRYENSKGEKICRICHFGSSKESEIIPLGCDCKGELGSSHQNCAEAWFVQKGNRLCEICGKTAQNVTSSNVMDLNETRLGAPNIAEDTSIFMMNLNEMRLAAATLDGSRENSRRCKRSLCNLLMAALVLAFVLPWFVHGLDML